ncbi:hypothetical protein [Helicobacter kayseriensis]|uniref:hypothetical protein n=1 Tax=Helicobacter kayseriensis TaxID=2905877 RepID=UPI001E2CD089|nr:hypothetical protein [Helicobacter kayseriensis]MCE3047774.1 hypothetical protein [Helicobacter kayseriensis]MCE3049127.1 hypothetical protein [Helicobacter kayseriensis]
MNFLRTLNHSLAFRTKREKGLILIACILGIYAFFFHHSVFSWLEEIQTLQKQIKEYKIALSSSQTSPITHSFKEEERLHRKLQELIQVLNSQSLPWSTTLKQINNYARNHKITLWSIDSQDEGRNYTLLISGNTSFYEIFSFLDFIEQLPMIHIQSFDLFENGNFSITLKNHMIFPTDSKHSNLNTSSVIASVRKSLLKDQLSFDTPLSEDADSQNPEQNLQLEAIFNHRAKINGIWLQVNDTIGHFTLTSISPHSITLKSKNQEITLTLSKKSIFQ